MSLAKHAEALEKAFAEHKKTSPSSKKVISFCYRLIREIEGYPFDSLLSYIKEKQPVGFAWTNTTIEYSNYCFTSFGRGQLSATIQTEVGSFEISKDKAEDKLRSLLSELKNNYEQQQ